MSKKGNNVDIQGIGSKLEKDAKVVKEKMLGGGGSSGGVETDIDDSEGLILLRQTYSGKFSSRRKSPASDKDRDLDTISDTTTTSDVNSIDDAASIVSRISQIVVEEEEKLMNDPFDHENTTQSWSEWRSNSSMILDSCKSNTLRPNMNRVRSATNVPSQQQVSRERFRSAGGAGSDGCGGQGQQLENDDSGGRRINQSLKTGEGVIIKGSGAVSASVHNDETTSSTLPPESSSSLLNGNEQQPVDIQNNTERLPEIHVIKDDHDHDSRAIKHKKEAAATLNSSKDSPKDTIRIRTKSFYGMPHTENKNDPEQQPIFFIRRNESSGFLPERGDLRRLESSRNPAMKESLQLAAKDASLEPLRLRSNTAGCMDKSTLLGTTNNINNNNNNDGQLMLNIVRSAWTLPEFEQTFNKSSDKSQSSSLNELNRSVSTDSMCDTLNLQQQKGGSYLERQQSLKGGGGGGGGLERQSSSNLLIRASKNAIGLSQNPAHCSAINGAHTGRGSQPMPLMAAAKGRRLSNSVNDRRPSRHSIVSFTSSLDSFYSRKRRSGVSKGLGLGSDGKNTKGDDGDADKNSCFRSCCNMETFSQYLPILEWLPAYNLNYLWGDLMAGLAVAVLNISTSLSAALVAETDLSVAFRASIVNTFVYSILCSSKHTSFGSWSIMSQMLLVSVRRALNDELILDRLQLGPSASWEPEEYERWHLNIIIMYTFLIGLVQLICGLLNLGNILASFIPEALCSGMITATAFTMAIGQLANMCGTTNKILRSIERNSTLLWAESPPLDITDIFNGLFRWIQQIALLVKHYDQINTACVIISVVSVILLFANQCVIQKQLERLFKRKILIPFEMILLIAMIIISYSLNLAENYRVTTCGPIHIDFVIPNLPNFRLIRELWFESLATALISYTMVYIMAKTYSNKLNYEVDCNQELIACGAGNLIGGLFDALPATASFSRTAGQVEAGGQTQMASLINCVVLVVTAQLLGHHVALLPVCVMSATLFYGFVRMMTRFSEVFIYWRVCKVDFAIWVVTFVAILTVDLVNGFAYGFIFSILTMLYRAQNRRCYMLGSIGTSDVYVPLVKYPIAQEVESIKIFQFCGPIHYVSADLFERLLRQKTRANVKQVLRHIMEQEAVKFNPRDLNLPTHIILDFSMISYIDSAGLNIIKKVIEDYQRINVTILLASLASHVATVVKSDPSLWDVHKERFYVTLADAVHCAMRDSYLQSNTGTENICLEC